jgi:hypothetical protein
MRLSVIVAATVSIVIIAPAGASQDDRWQLLNHDGRRRREAERLVIERKVWRRWRRRYVI